MRCHFKTIGAVSIVFALTLGAVAESSAQIQDYLPDETVCRRALNSERSGWFNKDSFYAEEAVRRGLTVDACSQLAAPPDDYDGYAAWDVDSNAPTSTATPPASTAPAEWYTPPASTPPADWYKDANAAVNRDDFATALRIIRPLADQGIARAEGFLGLMFSEGYGVPRDYAEAMKWYRRAADHGDAGAQFFIGMMYRDGKGVPKDYIQAYLWLNLASSSSEPQGPHMTLGKMASEVRDFDVASKMTPAQIAEAQRLAREWKPPPLAPIP
jgi:hypothetical protein